MIRGELTGPGASLTILQALLGRYSAPDPSIPVRIGILTYASRCYDGADFACSSLSTALRLSSGDRRTVMPAIALIPAPILHARFSLPDASRPRAGNGSLPL